MIILEKFSYATNGYNCEEVNQFISDVIVQTENIVARCKEQRREIEELKKELEHYKELENTLKMAILKLILGVMKIFILLLKLVLKDMLDILLIQYLLIRN